MFDFDVKKLFLKDKKLTHHVWVVKWFRIASTSSGGDNGAGGFSVVDLYIYIVPLC